MPDTPNAPFAPMLSVRRGGQAVEFYKSAFGTVEQWRMESPDGEIVARLSIDGAEFWVADESPAHGNPSPETLGGCSTRMVLTVDDPDAVYARAIALGARQEWPVADQDYGWRVGRLTDPYGHVWEIGKPLPQPTQPS